MIITSIKTKISREQAVAKFRDRFNELRYGRLQMVTDFYIPYRFFRMNRSDRRSSTRTFIAADAVTGKLDLIQFDRQPEEGACLTVDTAMVAEELINEAETYRLVRESMMRSIFMKGFFKLSRVNVEVEMIRSLHIPYWTGVYERGDRAHLEIINALRGRFEGAKIREVLAEWFQRRG
ncbi:MAG: hypothetical protein J2P21_27495 [Chloracidobacterium sp.]|nr:hypothetical protein [Chloracidobacterium sp.]